MHPLKHIKLYYLLYCIRPQSVNCSVRVSRPPQFRIRKPDIFGAEKWSFGYWRRHVVTQQGWIDFFTQPFVTQFLIFNPWKVPWKWIAFYQNYFVISPGLLYHLIRRDSGWLAKEAFISNAIVSSKRWLNGLKITNWTVRFPANLLFWVCQSSAVLLNNGHKTCVRFLLTLLNYLCIYMCIYISLFVYL